MVKWCDSCKYVDVTETEPGSRVFGEPCNHCFRGNLTLDESNDKWVPWDSDPVNHPGHYETGKFECIEVMEEVFGVDALKEYCLINAFKYLWRCKRKGKKVEDVKKAIWYLNKFVEKEEGEAND